MVSHSQGIAVDAAHSEKQKKTEYQGVNLETGEIVFYRDLGHQTVNIGEFLAVVEGIKYVISHPGISKVVFTDSTTALSWIQNKSTASNKRNKLVEKAEAYLKACAIWVDEVKILKWNNDIWGENPADFGNK